MKQAILGMLAETFIHVGVGQNEGAIDLPAAREAATYYPYVPGSGFKGALKDRARETWPDEKSANEDGEEVFSLSKPVLKIFGAQDNGGQLLVSDLRLLMLPVRSLTGCYRWVTCPHLLERFQRDIRRAKFTNLISEWEFPELTEQKGYLGKSLDTKKLYLEEWGFNHVGKINENLIHIVQSLVANKEAAKRVEEQLVIVRNEDFTRFARYALPVQARNVLDENKSSQNLWYEESLPADTVMYALLSQRQPNSCAVRDIVDSFSNGDSYLQVGGNETVGQGWFLVEPLNNDLAQVTAKEVKQ